MTVTEVFVGVQESAAGRVRRGAPSAVGNYVRFRLGPQRRDRARRAGQTAGRGHDRTSGRTVDRRPAGRRRGLGDYERLLGDAIDGDATLFARQDVVEAAWAIVNPLIQNPGADVRVRAGVVGTRRSRSASSPTSAAGTRRPDDSAPVAFERLRYVGASRGITGLRSTTARGRRESKPNVPAARTCWRLDRVVHDRVRRVLVAADGHGLPLARQIIVHRRFCVLADIVSARARHHLPRRRRRGHGCVAASAGAQPAASAPAPQVRSAAGAAARTTRPATSGTDTCVDLSHRSGGNTQGHAARAGEEPAIARGGAGLRSLPRSRSGARGRRHERTIRSLKKPMKPDEINETCLTCHNRGNHAGWEGSAHERRNLSCTTCHSVHSPKSSEQQLVKTTQTELCATCHRAQVAKTERAVAHMPVREGKMSCSSCHNPHGSISNVKAAEDRQLGRRDLRQLPHRDARAGAVGARAGAGELRDLPRSARLVERSDAGRAHADALSALSRRDAASGDRSTTRTKSPPTRATGCSDGRA